MKRNFILFGAIGVLSALIGIYVANGRSSPAPAASQAVAALYQQSLPDAKGTVQTLATLKGQPVLLNFWAPWCAPCVEEMPELSSLQAEVSAKKIQIVGIGIDSASNIAEFSTKHKIAYPLYVAGMDGTALSRAFGNKAGGLPFTVLIGADGTIRKTYLGRLDMAKVRADLASL